jgi:hypothetical protein
MLVVDLRRDGRMWLTNYYLARLTVGRSYDLEQVFDQQPTYQTKSRLRPVFDLECTAAKRWAESMILTPMELLAMGLK